jgi:hypothetical protein
MPATAVSIHLFYPPLVRRIAQLTAAAADDSQALVHSAKKALNLFFPPQTYPKGICRLCIAAPTFRGL